MPNRDLSMISGSTRALAVLGYPARHSLSPLIQNAALAAAALDYCYLALEVKPEDIEDAVRGLRALGFAGFNLTAPHKQSVIPLLDELTEEAKAIGAVNTVANRDGRLIGTNTDATGFQRLLEINGMYRQGMKAVILGAGGAARAGFYALGKVAGELVVLNRTVDKAAQLVDSLLPYAGDCHPRVAPMDGDTIARELAGADVLVNTTSVGMHPNGDDCPLPEGIEIPTRCGVVDMIYAPPRTRLLQRAESSRCRCASGHDMLLYQAVDAFKFWTGIDPDVGVMDAALRQARGT